MGWYTINLLWPSPPKGIITFPNEMHFGALSPVCQKADGVFRLALLASVTYFSAPRRVKRIDRLCLAGLGNLAMMN